MRNTIWKFVLSAVVLFVVQSVAPDGAYASTVVAKIDLSSQRMQVYVNGKRKYVWRVSTGKKGWRTPKGSFQPYSLRKKYFEKRWNMRLPYLVMINYSGGIGIHGTYQTGKLGRPASHGCIRLSVGNAAKFYGLVKKYGLSNSRVTVTK